MGTEQEEYARQVSWWQGEEQDRNSRASDMRPWGREALQDGGEGPKWQLSCVLNILYLRNEISPCLVGMCES